MVVDYSEGEVYKLVNGKTDDEILEKLKVKVKCDICGRELSCRGSLLRHKKRKHLYYEEIKNILESLQL